MVARGGLAQLGLAMAVCLSGCGGGGDGASGASPTPVPPPPPAPSTVPLTLTAANAEDAASLSQGLAHTAIALAHQAIALLDNMKLPVEPGAQTCRGGGSMESTWLDRNSNGMVDAGDRVGWRLASCWLDSVEERFLGRWAVEITSRDTGGSRWAGRLEFGNDFFTGDTQGNSYLEGQLQFSQTGTHVLRELHVGLASGSDWRLRVTPAASTQTLTLDRVTQLEASWASRRDSGRNTIQVQQFTLQSEVLKGQVQLRTVQAWASWLDAEPDAGESELAGAGTQRLRIALGAKLPSLSLRLSLDGSVLTATPSFQDATQRVLYSSGAWLPPPAQALGYPLEDGARQAQRLLAQPASTGRWSPKQRLEWWFARPLEGADGLAASFGSYDTAWGVSGIPAKVSVEGGLISVEPETQLAPGATYQLSMPAPLNAFVSGHVDAVISASLVAPARRVLAGAGDSLQLDGSGSRTAAGGAVASYRWRQLSGPLLALSATDTAQIRVQAAIGSGNGAAELELQVTDAAGFFDRRRVTLVVVGDPASARWGLRESAGAPIEWWVEGLQPDSNFSSQLTFLPAINAAQWSFGHLVFGQRLPLGVPWLTGQRHLFDTANSVETHAYAHADVDSQCSTRAGHFDILQVEQNDDGSFRRLAVDIDYVCQPSGRRHRAQLRWDSSVLPSGFATPSPP